MRLYDVLVDAGGESVLVENDSELARVRRAVVVIRPRSDRAHRRQQARQQNPHRISHRDIS